MTLRERVINKLWADAYRLESMPKLAKVLQVPEYCTPEQFAAPFEAISPPEPIFIRPPYVDPEFDIPEFREKVEGFRKKIIQGREARIYHVKGALLEGKSFALRLSGKISSDLTPYNAARLHPETIFRGYDTPLRPKRKIDHGVVFAMPLYTNYFHWMLEMLPRLEILAHSDYQSWPIWIPEKAPRFVIETLDATIGLDRVQKIKPGLYRLGESIALPYLSQIDHPTPTAVEFTRNIFGPLGQRTARKLYLSRRDAGQRRIVNEDEIMPVLAKRGFEIVELAGKSVREQAEIFSQAEIVVGSHGAGFSNMVFAPKDAKLVELISPGRYITCFYNLSCAIGFEHYLLPCEPHEKRDTRVDPQKLERRLVSLGY